MPVLGEPPTSPAGTGSLVAGSTTAVRELTWSRKPRPGPESSVAVPLKPDSEEPKLLSSRAPGSSARNWPRTVSDRIAPELLTLNSEEQSVPWSGPASASTSGRSMASPTSDTQVTRSRSTVRSTSSGTYLRCRTTFWPKWKAMNAVRVEVPCISGGVGKNTRPSSPAATRSASSCGRRTGSPVGAPPPIPEKNRSSWRHITPLGMPVVPPV